MLYKNRIRTQAEYEAARLASIENPEGFWAEVASNLQWQKPWDKVLDW